MLRGLKGGLQWVTGPDSGTVLRILIPEPVPGLQAEVSAQPLVSRPGARILLVDDETSMLTVIRDCLSRQGFQVTSTNDPTRALQWLRDSPDGFDLLLTDLSMPLLSGKDLIIQAHRLNPGLPAVLMSGVPREELTGIAWTCGAKGALYKPATFWEILECISGALGAPRAADGTHGLPGASS